MAKKKVEEPVYPAAPLVITKDRFIELLTAQIEKGKELLGITVPLATFNDPHWGYARRPVESMEYDEAAEKDFTAKFKRWHDRNKEVYRSSFSVPNSIYFHEYEMQEYDHLVYNDIIKIYKDDISRLMNQMQTDIERIDLIKCTAIEEKAETIKTEERTMKPYRVFISHSSKDKEFVKHLVDLLEVIGIDGKDKLFCSSVPLYGIDLSGKIFETLLSQFKENQLFVLYIHSANYYESPVSLNEMGAAWVLQSDHCSFLTKGFPFEGMKGVVKDDEIAIKVDVDTDEVSIRMNQLKDKLINLFKLPKLDNDKWEWKRNLFLERVNN